MIKFVKKSKAEKKMEEGSVNVVSIAWKDFSSQAIFEKIHD